MSELLWIAVPGGAVTAEGLAPLAVVIVPRLEGGGEDLAGHGMDRWPELLHATTFELEQWRYADPEVWPWGETFRGRIEPTFRHTREAMLANWQAMFATPSEAPISRVDTPRRDDPTKDGIELLATATEASELRNLYAQEVSGDDWRAQLERVAAAASPRRARAERRSRPVAERRGRPPPSFHDVVAFLREHPQLLRAFGLIVDFEVAVWSDVEEVRVVPTLPPWPAGPSPQASCPWTSCSLDAGRFLAKPRPDGGLARGVVRLGGAGPVGGSDNPDWAVVTFDVDAAMTRVPTADEPEPALPGLRSAGLGLLHTRRERELRTRLGRASRGGSVDGAYLFADDLVLGYRVDVSEEGSGEWRSLCERRAEYTVGGRPLGLAGGWVEEGHVKRDAMTAAAGGPLECDELVVRWDGWSLVVPRPAPRGRGEAPRPTPLDWRFSVVPPLPRLRFGRDYRLRLRIADLAGGGLTVDDLAADGSPAEATEPVFYGRVEPVPAPLVATTGEYGPGEAIERLVIRGPGGPPPEVPDPDPKGVPPADPVEREPHLPPPDGRLLSVPPVSVELADKHGFFDGEADGEAAWQLARRAMPGLRGVEVEPAERRRPAPWLPDPLANQWVVQSRGTPATAAASGPWEAVPGSRRLEYAPVELELTGGTAVQLSRGEGKVSISLPAAQQLEVDVSCAPAASDAPQLAMLWWMPNESFEAIWTDVLRGRHPHITPARTLHLVHAVQRPLKRPVGHLVASREPGETFATLTSASGIALDRASTARLDLNANWKDWSDHGEGPDKFASVGSDVVTTGADPWPLVPKRHEFGDTRRRRVIYRLSAVSRFQEYFDPRLLKSDPQAFAIAGDAMAVDIFSSARPAPPVVLHTVPAFTREGPDPQPGWQEWRRLRRGGLLRVHMPEDWYSSGQAEQLAVVVWPEDFPPREAWPFLSEAGRDPIFGATDPKHWLVSSDLAGPQGAPAKAYLEELGTEVPIVPFTPWWDPELGGWNADVDLGPLGRTSYRPFVELALVRYQPLSLDRLHISPVVRSEMIQLLPERNLTVVRVEPQEKLLESETLGEGMWVTLSGMASGEPRNRVEAWIERWTGPPDEAPGTPTTSFTTLEEPVHGSPLRSWVRVPGCAGQALFPDAVWVPQHVGSAEQHRLVIREIEMLPQPGGDTSEPPTEFARRVVFIETALL